jgi:hypothetical protein
VTAFTVRQPRGRLHETVTPGFVTRNNVAVRGEDAPLYRRVERQVPKLARRMIAQFVEEIPLYGLLPREQLEGEITAITEDNLRVFFRSLRQDRAPTDEELAEIRLSAARRAEERVPLDAVLTAYHVGGRMGWQALVEAATPADTDALIAAGERVLAYVQHVTAAVAAAYLEEQQAIYGEERDAQRALAVALLTGQPAESIAARLGVTLAPAYAVLALVVDEHPDEHDPGVSGAVAARRKVRRLLAHLEAQVGEPVLGLLDRTGGSALIPMSAGSPEEVQAAVAPMVKGLEDAVGTRVNAAVALADDPADVARAATQARDVVRLAERLGLPAGLHTLADVLLEYQLTRSSDARPLLLGLLEPLARSRDLLVTLETYLAHDLDRRKTAAALHVHPNTLDYRLRRVVELSGVDPSTARGLQLLGAALTARRFVAE